METIILEKVHISGEEGLFQVTVKDGIFSDIRRLDATGTDVDSDAVALWLAPGFIDMHVHAAWTDFDHDAQERRSIDEQDQRIIHYMKDLVRDGFTAVRDAGGMTSDRWNQIRAKAAAQNVILPRLIPCADMLSGDSAHNENTLESLKKSPETWVKIFATGGSGAPADRVLEPLLSREDFFYLVDFLHQAGKSVMVHTWGGETLDWSIEAGVQSVEHCVYMTKQQAAALARAGIPYVATTYIYRMIANPANPLSIPEGFEARGRIAIAAHQKAVQAALEAGVTILNGTDFFADPAISSWELEEIESMTAYGLSWKQALSAATELPGSFLGLPIGRIQKGYAADGVLYTRDPLSLSSASELRASIRGTIIEGCSSY